MGPGLAGFAWEVFEICFVWPLVWLDAVWFGLLWRRAPLEVPSQSARFGPWRGLVWSRFRLRGPGNLIALGPISLESSQFARCGFARGPFRARGLRNLFVWGPRLAWRGARFTWDVLAICLARALLWPGAR